MKEQIALRSAAGVQRYQVLDKKVGDNPTGAHNFSVRRYKNEIYHRITYLQEGVAAVTFKRQLSSCGLRPGSGLLPALIIVPANAVSQGHLDHYCAIKMKSNNHRREKLVAAGSDPNGKQRKHQGENLLHASWEDNVQIEMCIYKNHRHGQRRAGDSSKNQIPLPFADSQRFLSPR